MSSYFTDSLKSLNSQEAVPDQLSGLPAFEKVITEEETKTYSVKAEIFILDKQNGKNYKECKVLYENPVAVKNDEDKIIGSAVVYVADHSIVADITLDYSTPERFNIETKSIPVYPHIGYEAEGVVFKEEMLYTKMLVNEIRLEQVPNVDTRVVSL